jgi:hypothetical protein
MATPAPADLSALVRQVEQLANEVGRLNDVHAVRKLQHAYGYYLDKCLYDEVVDLFAADGEVRFMGGAFRRSSSRSPSSGPRPRSFRFTTSTRSLESGGSPPEGPSLTISFLRCDAAGIRAVLHRNVRGKRGRSGSGC